MSQLIDRLERDLREIAAGADPSPSAWESIVARLGEDGPSDVTLVLAPAPDRSRRPVWIAMAAAAVVVVIGTVAVLVTRAGDDAISTAEPESTTDSSVAPQSTTTDVAPTNPPTASPFVGNWVSTDTDGSSQTMEIVPAGAEYEIVVRDDTTTTCGGTAATIAGAAAMENDATLVIAQPELTCDDGSAPAIGPPPQADLADFTLALDPATGALVDSAGRVWRRPGSNEEPLPASTATSPTTVPTLEPGTSGGWWPQTTLRQVRAAQELADLGDPAATWQLDENLAASQQPWGAEIFSRFIEQELGWDEFAGASSFGGYVSADGDIDGVVFVRCAPGATNPLSPLFTEAPAEIRACAPTIDDFTYETVSFNVSQPERRGASGIWIVDRWEILESKPDSSSRIGLLSPDPFDGSQIEQVIPPSDEDVTALLQAFLGARVAGEGAEQHLLRQPAGSPIEDVEVPLLYATTSGAPYERFEIERVRGPVWPNGWTEYEVRLFAGETVVEQYFHVIRHEDGELELLYGYSDKAVPTTENGQSVGVPYSLLDGEVTFTAAPPWGRQLDCWDKTGGMAMVARDAHCIEHVRVATTSPVPGCGDGPPADSAQAIILTLMADPNVETTEPVPVRIAGIDALQLDVTVEYVEPEIGSLITFCWLGQTDARMRLYLIDLPEGMSAPTLAISITAPDETFDDVLVEATRIVESIQLHP